MRLLRPAFRRGALWLEDYGCFLWSLYSGMGRAATLYTYRVSFMFGAGYPRLFWALVSSRLGRGRAQRLVCVMDKGQKAIRTSVQDTGVVNHILCEGEAVV